MKRPLFIVIVLLFLLSACAPAAETPSITATPAVGANKNAPVAVATSRGDKLVASDPASVKLGEGKPVLVEFFRFTWYTCRTMAPMVHGLEAKYFGQMEFYFLDADDPNTQPFQKQFGFNYQPEFYLLDGEGNVVKKWIGSVAQDEFEKEFASLLSE